MFAFEIKPSNSIPVQTIIILQKLFFYMKIIFFNVNIVKNHFQMLKIQNGMNCHAQH